MNITLKVAGVIKNTKNEVLLIKEKYREEDGYKWNLVKGTFDNTEETLEDCIKRELHEEIGLENIENISLKRIFHYGTKNEPKILFVFYGYYSGDEVPSLANNMQDENIVEIKWFPREEKEQLSLEDCMSPAVYDSIKEEPKIAIFQTGGQFVPQLK
ncbi:MAG: NUDIX hydrolase [Candidatus Magasanikbacteria bacterium]